MFKFEDYLDGTCGSFKQAMARAIQLADIENREKIRIVFPDVYEKYMEWFNREE